MALWLFLAAGVGKAALSGFRHARHTPGYSRGRYGRSRYAGGPGDREETTIGRSYVTARLLKGSGRYDKVEASRRLYVRFSVVRGDEPIGPFEYARALRQFQITTSRELEQGTSWYMEQRTPERTGKLRRSYETNVEILSRRSGYLECRYNRDLCHYGRWVPRVGELLQSKPLERRMRKAFRDGAYASQR